MTISTTTRTAGPFVGTGSVTVYGFAFKVFEASDLLLVEVDTDGVQTELVLDSDYTVALNFDQEAAPGGSITLTSALALDHRLTITSDLAVVQPVSIRNGGRYYPDVIEDALDRLVMVMQQQQYTSLVQALRVPEVEGTSVLPSLVERAGKFIYCDALGNFVAAPGTPAVLETQASETGGVPELVQVWIQRERVMPQQFGCAADGGLNDQTVNLQRAINAAALRKMPLNLNGLRWKANSGLLIPAAGVEWENGEIYMPGVASASYGVSSAGAAGGTLSLSAPVARGDEVLPMVSTTGLVVGEWYKLTSSDLWADNGSGNTVTLGEWVRIRSIVGLNVRLCMPLRDAYTTAPHLRFVSWVDHIYLTDVRFTGGGAGLGQNGVLLAYCRDARIHNSEARNIAARGLAYDHCMDIEIDGGIPGDGDDSTGLSYGHIIAGPTLRARARSVRGDGLRHVVTAGGSSGVVRNFRCDGITGTNMTDATVDAHPAVDDFVATDIRHEGDTYTDGATPMGADGDGIVSQALTTHIDGYVIRRPGRHGILIQPACKLYKGRAKVGQGEIRDHGAYSSSTGWAINFSVDYNASLGLTLASVDGADIESAEAYANGIQISASTSGIATGQIGARVTTQGRAVLARGDGQTIANLQILGGYYERTNTTSETVMLWGTASGQVTQSKVLGAYLKGGTYGVRGLNATSSNVSHNTIKGYGTGAITGITHNGTTDFVVDNET